MGVVILITVDIFGFRQRCVRPMQTRISKAATQKSINEQLIGYENIIQPTA